jgi:hypothetical protein
LSDKKSLSLPKKINGIPQIKNTNNKLDWTEDSDSVSALVHHLNILVLPRTPLNPSCSILQIETMKNYSKELHIIILTC